MNHYSSGINFYVWKSSSNGTPTSITTVTDIYWYQAAYMLPSLSLFIGLPTNLNGVIFSIGKGLSKSILCFLDSSVDRLSIPFFTSAECDIKDNYVDTLFAPFFVQYYVALLYCDIISHSHIILYGWYQIMNWYNKTFLDTCGTRGVNWPLIQIMFQSI